jgi:hypothetical protein
MTPVFKSRLKVLVIIHTCFSLAGCATPAAWRLAEKQANKPPTHWSIEHVDFASTSGPDDLRLCVRVRETYDSDRKPVAATVTLDLEKLVERAHITDGSASPGKKLKLGCDPELQTGERSVPIVHKQSDAEDSEPDLVQYPADELTVFVLERAEQNSILIAAPSGENVPGKQIAVSAQHSEDSATNAGYLLMPFAVVVDIAIVTLAAVGCLVAAFGGGACM